MKFLAVPKEEKTCNVKSIFWACVSLLQVREKGNLKKRKYCVFVFFIYHRSLTFEVREHYSVKLNHFGYIIVAVTTVNLAFSNTSHKTSHKTLTFSILPSFDLVTYLDFLIV